MRNCNEENFMGNREDLYGLLLTQNNKYPVIESFGAAGQW